MNSWWSKAVGKWAEARAVGNAQRCPRQVGRCARRAQSDCALSAYPQPGAAKHFRGRCAKPGRPLSRQLVG